MGWNKNKPSPLKEIDEASKFLKVKLDSSPVIIPTYGWPEKTEKDKPEDWSWRAQNIIDLRPEKDRPELSRVGEITDGKKERTIDALRDIARRHIAQAKQVNYTRQILFKSNLGIVTFDKSVDGTLFVQHTLHAAPEEADIDKPPQKHEAYTLHRIALDAASDEKKPEIQKKQVEEKKEEDPA
jgi:hypothetical protein